VEALPDASGRVLVASHKGLYLSDASLNRWDRIYTQSSAVGRTAVAEDSASTDFLEAEEVQSNRLSRISFLLSYNSPVRILLIHQGRILSTQNDGQDWKFHKINTLPSLVSNVKSLNHNNDKLFIPTERGVYFYHDSTDKLQDISWGLPDPHIRDVVYAPEDDALFVATEKGAFRLAHPEISLFLNTSWENKERGVEHILGYFSHEPSVQELQEVAMRYAEVHPEKILAWRRGVAMKAWLPSLTIGYDYDEDETVELDRGGTKDPDRFIRGPVEADRGLSLDLKWDLSDIVWNDSETSIDNRSKLMVQLRDDLLNQLTHLYYARRRLQITSLMRPYQDVGKELERRLQIAEYTAGIDALTGGYFSHQVKAELWVNENPS